MLITLTSTVILFDSVTEVIELLSLLSLCCAKFLTLGRIVRNSKSFYKFGKAIIDSSVDSNQDLYVNISLLDNQPQKHIEYEKGSCQNQLLVGLLS